MTRTLFCCCRNINDEEKSFQILTPGRGNGRPVENLESPSEERSKRFLLIALSYVDGPCGVYCKHITIVNYNHK